ncbi:MAG TPA: hypothetical protein K8V15_08765, partial [Tessaracoccus flavescens]|nr:hypothetical protein [Tessaracoccus flavescens]
MRDPLKLWATDLRLVGSTALRSLSDDPLQFLVQVARRAGKRSKPHHQRPTVLNAYRWFLADRPEVAARLLAESRHGPGLRRRLARRLLVQLGADRAHPSDPDRLRWLDRTQVGDLSGALAQVKPESAAGRRTASELRLLEPSASEHHRIPLQPASAGSHRALFVLTNSLPYTKSGYTYRSHAILKALNAVGVAAEASTRIGYPSTVGIPGRPRTAVVDGVRYHRIVSAGLPLELDERLDEQVSL